MAELKGVQHRGGGDNDTYVWAELEIANSTVDVLAMRIVKMSINNLFGEGQRTL